MAEDVYFELAAISFLFCTDPSDIPPADENGNPWLDNLSILACYDFGVQNVVDYTLVEIKG